ncbi:ABC transporter permease subunit [Jiangella anatolica]|uniref:ABC transporter permease n=1 Tax=Jiangella anatolica TaxID=2670374 RepID=A0A2W2C1W4_9ACTN|nr:ABC transporter permease subunit [Jiangella anatolica]PZF86714.1 ABC transporter permease [Jiangella anatolica]
MTAQYRLSFGRVVRSEWTKLWSLRSTWWVLGLAGLLTVALASIVGWASRQDGGDGSVRAAVENAFIGVDGLSLILGVFGVVLMTGEYGSGLIRATLTAVPRRRPVLPAKALVLVAATLPFCVVVCFASFLAHQAFAGPAGDVTLADPGVVRATFGAAAAPVGLALLGLGIGTMLRHTAGALAAYVGAVLVVPALLGPMLPDRVEDDVLPYVPTFSGQAMYAVGESQTFPWLLSPGSGALVLAGWILVFLAGGATVLQARDA